MILLSSSSSSFLRGFLNSGLKGFYVPNSSYEWFDKVLHGLACPTWFRVVSHAFVWLGMVVYGWAWLHMVERCFARFRVVLHVFASF